jgi:(p)ppGpp synthase/HD superfamily hydrolase
MDAKTTTTPLLSLTPAAYLWQYAAAIAAEAHQDQSPPGSTMPYFAHPARVATVVSAVFGCNDPEVLAAAYLHDVLEKTNLNREGMAIAMGERVACWVEWLSKNTRGGKKQYWELLAQAPWQARLIKMADALDHLNGPPVHRGARIKSARKALKLATSDEPEIRRAAAALAEAIDCLAGAPAE